MFEKLEEIEKKYEELNKKLTDPEVISNGQEYGKIAKEQSDLSEIVAKFREYKKYKEQFEESEELLKDPEMKELAKMEYEEAKEAMPKIEEELKILLIPKDPNDDKNVICEIRSGAGGEEAALFLSLIHISEPTRRPG